MKGSFHQLIPLLAALAVLAACWWEGPSDDADPPLVLLMAERETVFLLGHTQGFTLLGAPGGAPPYAYRVSGALPPGFSFDASTNHVGGESKQVGSWLITHHVTDSAGATDSNRIRLTVNRRASSP